MRKFKMITLACIMVATMLTFGACSEGVSEEKQEELDKLAIQAEDYYESKYVERVAVDKYEYNSDDGMFGTHYDTSVAYFYMEDGSTVRWTEKDNKFSDDYQADTIDKYVKNELEDYYEGDGYEAYYPGEISIIEKYFTALLDSENVLEWIAKNEEISISTGGEDNPIYVIGDAEELIEDICTYFRGENNLTIIQVEDDKLMSNLKYGDEGCIAQYELFAGKKEKYTQNYIEIGEGVYATAKEDGLIFEAEDIKLVTADEQKVMADAEKIYNAAYDKEGDVAYNEKINSILAQTDIVAIECSDKVKVWMDEHGITRDWITVVVRVDQSLYDNEGKLCRIELDKYVQTSSTYDTQFEQAIYVKDSKKQYFFIGDMETE